MDPPWNGRLDIQSASWLSTVMPLNEQLSSRHSLVPHLNSLSSCMLPFKRNTSFQQDVSFFVVIVVVN